MIQVISPDSFINSGPFLRAAYVRFDGQRKEVTLSPYLLQLIEHKRGHTVLFHLDSQAKTIYISSGLEGVGFNVSLNKGQGRVYSAPLIQLTQHILETSIQDPVSIPVLAIPRIINGFNLYKLYTNPLKQSETVSDERNAVVLYKGMAYTKKSLLSQIRAYYSRSFSSTKKTTRDRNRRRYDDIKAFCIEHGVEVDWEAIEQRSTKK
jgi:hypothetical protein